MENKIEQIGKIISEYGSFSVGELEQSLITIPCVGSRGNLTDLVEYVMEDGIDVEVWDERSSDVIDSYSVSYNELSEETLDDILELCTLWEENNQTNE